jgi:formylglycine-generating enzyme required for sulfatase activity
MLTEKLLMNRSIPPDLLPRTRQIILPLVGTDDDREALLTDAFYLLPDTRLYHQIKRDGTPLNFTTLCIKTLIDYGCLTGDMHALGQLLSVARMYCGVDKHPEIDALVGITNTLCIEPTPQPAQTLPISPIIQSGIQSSTTPIDERRPTVFISYSHQDDQFTQKLMLDLNTNGHTCWIDTSAIKGGADWQRAICDGINLSYAMIVICTLQALESEYVWDEIQWARTRGKDIVPVLLEDVTADDRFFGLHRFQGIRFDRLPYQDALNGLLDALKAPPTLDLSSSPRTVSRREHELTYLDRLRFSDFRLEKFELAEYASLGGIAQQRQSRTDIWEQIAIQQEFAIIPQKQGKDDEFDSIPEPFTDAVSKINELGRVVVLGEPGAGKTHTLRAIAKPLYTTALTDPKAPLPLMVKLGNWDGEKANLTFESFLRDELDELGAYLDELIQDNRAVLLLDGLNEFPADQRTKKYPQIEAFIKSHRDLTVVVTCREADYPISLGLSKILIRPLDPLRIRDFARRALKAIEHDDAFFWKLVGEEARRFEKRFTYHFSERLGDDWEMVFWLADGLPDGLKWEQEWINTVYYSWELWHTQRDDPASILTLARNPYMLRMLLDVYLQYKGQLPSNRGQLFEQFVNVLLQREKLGEIDPLTQAITLTSNGEALLANLQKIAFQMQIQRAQSANKGAGAGTALDIATVRETLDQHSLYLAVSASILSMGDEVRFTHQLLQEYFAAKYMDVEIKAGRLQAETIWKPQNWWERTNWEEAVILLAGLYSDDCTPVVEWVNRANPEVAALCIMRSGAKLADATREKLRDEWMSRLIDIQLEPNPKARAGIGRALGLTNWDNRKGVNIIIKNGIKLPDIEWVTIPAGEFTYQDSKMTLDYDFQIARYPVTYIQFQTFVDDPEGWHDPRWWEGLSTPDGHNKTVGEQAFKYHNHPRERVSWYDAMAFCRWYSWRLGGGYDLDAVDQWAVRLPTEFEWEKAARGNTGWAYPYGDTFDALKGNTSKTDLEQTSAVGLFSAGDARHWERPISDLSGNVWEWCLTDYRNPQNDAGQEDLRSGARRVLRGGSWSFNLDDARAVSRSYYFPSNRNYSYGFRVVCKWR